MVVATIILAAIITVSALLYFWWFSSDATVPQTPTVMLQKTDIAGGVMFSLSPTSSAVHWDEVRIYVTEGRHIEYWEPSEHDFVEYYPNVTVVLKNMTLGERTMGCEIYDQGLIGTMGMGDQFTIYGSQGWYIVTLVYEPIDGNMVQTSFFISS